MCKLKNRRLFHCGFYVVRKWIYKILGFRENLKVKPKMSGVYEEKFLQFIITLKELIASNLNSEGLQKENTNNKKRHFMIFGWLLL